MPTKDDNKMWESCSGIITPWGNYGYPRKSKRVIGLKEAYIVARQIALEVEKRLKKKRKDHFSAYVDEKGRIDWSEKDSLGVYWEIHEIKEEQGDEQ